MGSNYSIKRGSKQARSLARLNAGSRLTQSVSTPRISRSRLAWPMTILALALLVSGCARPSGDFGRAKPSFVHDKAMPLLGEQNARLRGDPVSKFNFTNDEKLLRDLSWGLIRPPHANDWIGGTIAELSRTRVLPEVEGRIPPDLYYQFLRTDQFQSSDARYDRIAADANGDAELVPPYCIVAKRVMATDSERLRVLATKQVVTEEVYEGAKARVWENRALIGWVGQALRFRIAAYQRAIEALEVETPSQDRLWKANSAVRTLEGEVRLAETNCNEGITRVSVDDDKIRRSRIYSNWGTERPPLVK
ncbi:hypothetical protein [Roseibium limicola]|nr:hypothetical protein [Roseibium limicola]